MKILIATLDDYPHIGGKSTHICSLIDGLKYQNAEVDVISRDCIDTWGYKLIKILMQPIKMYSIKKYLYYRRMSEFILFKRKLKKYLKNNSVDVISAQDALACSASGLVNTNIPLVLTMHTYFGLEYTLDNNYFTLEDDYYKKLLKLEQKSLSFTNNIIAVDKRILKHVRETINHLELNEEGYILESIHNFTNTDKFKIYNEKDNELLKKLNIKKDDFVILCIRRLVEKNGVIFAAKAMNEIKQNNRVKLLIIGDGPEKEKINEFIIENNIQNTTFMVGEINNDELDKWYSIGDCVVVPSITVNGLQEATSISAIESMACGKITIASNIGGIKELISNENTGILVQEKEIYELAKAINDISSNKEKRKKIEVAAREYVLNNHSHVNVAKKYYDIFLNAQ